MGKKLMKKALVKAMHGRTRILVTHAVHMLRYADKVVVIDEGTVRACGTVQQLEEQGLDLSSYAAPTLQRMLSENSEHGDIKVDGDGQDKQGADKAISTAKAGNKLVKEEDRKTGTVKLQVQPVYHNTNRTQKQRTNKKHSKQRRPPAPPPAPDRCCSCTSVVTQVSFCLIQNWFACSLVANHGMTCATFRCGPISSKGWGTAGVAVFCFS